MKNKFKMSLTWHNYETCPPEEDYNPYLFITNGISVIAAEYRKDEGFFVFERKISDTKNLWWADLEQTIKKTSKFNEVGP